MIENPKVGQRVFFLTHRYTVIPVTISGYSTTPGMSWVRTDESPVSDFVHSERLYNSPRAAAAALRSQAQDLLLAASKLEQEESE